MKTLSLLTFTVAFLTTASAMAATCDVHQHGGKVLHGKLRIEHESGGPVGNGEVTIGGVRVEFESGWGGVTEENGGSDKYVFQNFSVYRGDALLGEKDIGEEGTAFDLSLPDDKLVESVHCSL